MGKLIGWMLYCGFLLAIVVVGWRQPLKVQFGLKPTLSTGQPQATPPSWMGDQHRWDTSNRAAGVPVASPGASQSLP